MPLSLTQESISWPKGCMQSYNMFRKKKFRVNLIKFNTCWFSESAALATKFGSQLYGRCGQREDWPAGPAASTFRGVVHLDTRTADGTFTYKFTSDHNDRDGLAKIAVEHFSDDTGSAVGGGGEPVCPTCSSRCARGRARHHHKSVCQRRQLHS